MKSTYGTRELARPLWVLCLALSASGCATGGLLVEDLASPPHHRDVLVYAGTRHHAREIQHNRTRSRMHWASQVESLFDWWHFVDLPLCLVADTILLPYTLPRTLHTYWINRPTAAEIAVRPLVEEYSACIHNLRDLEVEKYLYALRHGLAASDALPQELGVYTTQVHAAQSGGPSHVCPAGGQYRVGARDEDPACSVHGTLAQANDAAQFLHREKRLPDPAPASSAPP